MRISVTPVSLCGKEFFGAFEGATWRRAFLYVKAMSFWFVAFKVEPRRPPASSVTFLCASPYSDRRGLAK